MPAWSWIVIAVVVVVVVALAMLVARSVSRRKRTERLKDHFGPEYDRAVGSPVNKAPPKRSSSPASESDKARHRCADSGIAGQVRRTLAHRATAFVDNPSRALGDADRLVTEVMRERGYPVDDFDQRAADISVDHPNVVEHYRAAHIIHLAQEGRHRHRGAA